MLWLMLLPAASADATGRLAVDIEQQLRTSILTDAAEYVIMIPNSVSSLPSDYDSIRVEPLGDSRPLGACWIKVFFFSNDGVFQTANLNLQINLFQDVLVAKEPIKVGQTLTPKLFDLSRREVTTLTDPPVFLPKELEGMSAARPVAAGKTLTQSLMQKQEIIKRGDLVTIEYDAANLKITASGEAKEPGSQGETIKVRNVSSNRIISAVVQDEKTVKISK
jgi:flagella basal body P-ring formation protein FlgA